MQIGIDSFAATHPDYTPQESIERLLKRMVLADQVGLDVFSLGEHHRSDFLDSAAHMILAAAAAKTDRITLGSAVTVLSAADPVRVFQNYATLDLLSGGRAEIVAGRGSFTEAFPLFGYDLRDYNELFQEKLQLLLKIRDAERVTWRGTFRSPLSDAAIYPRPVQEKLPVWVGVGGTPESFARAGMLGLPLMVAVIGGETHRFAPLVDLYRRAGAQAGHAPETLKVGLHSLGFVAATDEEAHEAFYPGYKKMFDKIGRERGNPPVTPERYRAQTHDEGALVVGGPQAVAEKILRHSKALGGIDRFTFQMDGDRSHAQLREAIRLIGEEVRPRVLAEN